MGFPRFFPGRAEVTPWGWGLCLSLKSRRKHAYGLRQDRVSLGLGRYLTVSTPPAEVPVRRALVPTLTQMPSGTTVQNSLIVLEGFWSPNPTIPCLFCLQQSSSFGNLFHWAKKGSIV